MINNHEEALRKGAKVESEHMTTYAALKQYVTAHKKWPAPNLFFAMIAKDHIDEIPDYYDRLAIMEKEAKK